MAKSAFIRPSRAWAISGVSVVIARSRAACAAFSRPAAAFVSRDGTLFTRPRMVSMADCASSASGELARSSLSGVDGRAVLFALQRGGVVLIERVGVDAPGECVNVGGRRFGRGRLDTGLTSGFGARLHVLRA